MPLVRSEKEAFISEGVRGWEHSATVGRVYSSTVGVLVGSATLRLSRLSEFFLGGVLGVLGDHTLLELGDGGSLEDGESLV